MASSAEWNAVDVMFSFDESRIYIFFSHTFDFIGMCSIEKALQNASNSSSTVSIAQSSCGSLSPQVYTPMSSEEMAVTGSTFLYKVRAESLNVFKCTQSLIRRGWLLSRAACAWSRLHSSRVCTTS